MVTEPTSGQAEGKELGAADAARFRWVVALANFVATERPDVQMPVSLRGAMVRPMQASSVALNGSGGI